MAPASPLGSEWDEGGTHGEAVMIDCLLPTGVIIQLNVRKDGLLAEIKEVCAHLTPLKKKHLFLIIKATPKKKLVNGSISLFKKLVQASEKIKAFLNPTSDP